MKHWDMYDHKNPSFSSTLLDEIYRSIDDGGVKPAGDAKFYRDISPARKQSKTRALEDREMANLRRTCLIEKWMEKKSSERVNVYRRQQPDIKSHLERFDHDRNALFFTSTSSSSDSSSGGFSSSNTESMFGTRSLNPSSCFSSSRLKAIRTCSGGRPAETERKKTLFDRKAFDEIPKSKSSVLKKVKQPISPGVRLAGLINSLFTAGNTRKSKNSTATATARKEKTEQDSTCSSASSFTRSCLSKNSATSIGNGSKRSVRFCPVSVIVDEDGPGLMPVSIPTAWKIGRWPAGKSAEKESKSQFTEKNRKVEAAAREFLMKNLKARNFQEFIQTHGDGGDDGGDDDDDGASCASSDLFELDHLDKIGQRMYGQELPVYETTHVETNRAISKGLLLQS